MYCVVCGKEMLSDAKFCPQCGKVIIGSPVTVPTTNNKQPKRAHPALIIFSIGLIVLGLQIFIYGINTNSTQDSTGINAFFGFLYFFLFIAFLASLFRKPKEVVLTTVNNVSPENLKDQKTNHSGMGKWIIIILIFLVLPAFFIVYNGGPVDPAVATAFIIIILAICAGFLWHFFKKHRETILRLFQITVNTIKFLIHHPVLTIVTTVVGIVLIVFIYSVFVQNNYKSLEQKLPGLQDNLAETATAKLMGDSIIAGRWVSNIWMGKIAETTKTTSDNLNQLRTPRILRSYKESIIAWNDSIASAAAYVNPWKNLSEDPSAFTLNLNDNKVNEYIETSLQKVALLKEAGDIAIKRQDRQTMYYIAGQLLVQEHWLDGIMHSANPGILGFRIKLFPSVLAWFPGPANRIWMCTSRTVAVRCGNAKNPVDLVNKIRHAAVEYAAAQPGADEQWDKITADQLKIPTNQGQYIETQGGVYNGEPNLPPQLSQDERAFVDECKAKGGTTANTGGVYARMPTTENGMACHHGNGCWDYLTRSSRRYSGGNPDCPEQNLLPPPPPPTSTPRPTRPPTSIPQPTSSSNQNISSWDGEYSTNTSGGCSGYGMSNSGIYPDRFTVRNNKVYTTLGASAGINSSGYVQISSSVAGYGYVETFHFYNSGGRAAVQGTIQLPNIQGISCSLNFSGSRQ